MNSQFVKELQKFLHLPETARIARPLGVPLSGKLGIEFYNTWSRWSISWWIGDLELRITRDPAISAKFAVVLSRSHSYIYAKSVFCVHISYANRISFYGIGFRGPGDEVWCENNCFRHSDVIQNPQAELRCADPLVLEFMRVALHPLKKQ